MSGKRLQVKNIILLIVGIVALLLFTYYHKNFIYMYRTALLINKDYLWLFDDSIVTNLDTLSSYSNYRKTDTLCLYHWAKGVDLNQFENRGITYSSDVNSTQYFNISVWDIYSLRKLQLHDINYQFNANLESVSIHNNNTLDSDTDQPTIIRLTNEFMNGLSIDVDNISNVDTIQCTPYYKGFYGRVRRILLKDRYGISQAILDYKDGSEPVLLITYQSAKGLILIIFTSAAQFDKSILSILNI